jgi:hypothetical protein
MSVHSLRAFSSLSISALMIATSPRESMAQECTLLHTQVKPALLRFLLFDAAIERPKEKGK